MMEIWKKDDVIVATGSLEPRTAVGSAYLVLKGEIWVLTWRGSDTWQSKWQVKNCIVKFKSIETPDGTVIDWGSEKSLKRFIPLRHFSIIESIAREEKFTIYDWEMFA